MTERLIDTNILVYAYDTSEGRKHKIAKQLLLEIWEHGGGVVCVQNLMEFFVVVTKKTESPISPAEAETIIRDIVQSDSWKVIDRDIQTLLAAVELTRKCGVHMWDAAIAACMRENGITVIVTENKKDFKKIQKLQIIEPFEK